MSKDPDQKYFSDGLTEVLTGDLSKISGLFVIARNSAVTYKGKAVKVQDVGREMGVCYVLEGSVQKADQRVRITSQLIEAATGYHLWSEQYDRPLTDIFTLQDEIVTTLKLQFTLEEKGWIARKHTDNVEAYDAFLRGVEYFSRYTKETVAQTRQMYERAIALDPRYADAYAMAGRYEEARAEAAEVLRLNPKFSLEVHRQRMPIKDPAVLDRHIVALRKAGLQ
jgi:adenylate cyclase